ncbi:MAG: threonylcarbamoyl-AMP synthase [Phycisphaerales bacterium]|nr:MAG: threonylcarbamoyl-AMP synthase [Phycisphaerales bacterium]
MATASASSCPTPANSCAAPPCGATKGRQVSSPNPTRVDPRIAEAAQRLRDGGVVAFPTETVYGLGADARDEAAVRRIYDLKGRPAHKPLTLHVSDSAMARPYARAWPQRAQALTDRFWPGPLTIVLPRSALASDFVCAGADGVGLRCPDHPLTLALIRALGAPIVGPSANRSGEPPAASADEVRAVFDERDVYVLDAGPCPGRTPSTVLDLTDPQGRERILRAGALSAEQLGVRDD